MPPLTICAHQELHNELNGYVSEKNSI